MLTKVMLTAITIAVASSAAAQPKPALGKPAVYPKPQSQFSVAGVSVGMSPDQVQVALTAAGYKLVDNSTGNTWNDEVNRHLQNAHRASPAKRIGGWVSERLFKKGLNESIRVVFHPFQGGAGASNIQYQIAGATMDEATFKQAVTSKYGRPTTGGGFRGMHCISGESACNISDYPARPRFPNLTWHSQDATYRTITLRIGEAALDADEASIKAEMDRVAPKTKAASF